MKEGNFVSSLLSLFLLELGLTRNNALYVFIGYDKFSYLLLAYSTTKVKDRGYLETVPQLVVKGVG